jgi:predicted RNA-binding Zn-ribbon protein involved in translation (DUF1610 family)
MSFSSNELKVVEEIERSLDELTRNLSLIAYRLGRLRLEKRLEKPSPHLLKSKIYSALNIMSHDYPNLWIDLEGVRYVTDARHVSYRHLYRLLRSDVHFLERSTYWRTFKSRHPDLTRPALKVLPYGLLCTSYKDEKPSLIVEHYNRKKFPRYVYRGKVNYGVTNAGLEGIMCLLRIPLFLKEVPTDVLVSSLIDEGDANAFNKAILFMVKSGRLERFRSELMDFGLKALHYFRKNRQIFEKLLKLQLQRVFSIRRRLDALMVECGLRRIHRYERGVDWERLMEGLETQLGHLPRLIDETSFKPELSHLLIQDCCEMLEMIRPEWEVRNGMPYIACPMCGYQIALQKDEARVFYENFHCRMCGFKPPKEVKVCYCEKCGGSVPVTDSLVLRGKTKCFRCGQLYSLEARAWK